MPNFTKLFLFSLLLLPCTAAYSQSSAPALNQFAQTSQLSFVENNGQIKDQHSRSRNDIDYYFALKDLSVFIGAGELHYQFFKPSPSPKNSLSTQQPSSVVETYRLDVSLHGANPNAIVVAEGKTRSINHFYNCGKNDFTANSFTSVTYKNIYPNIDWQIYTAGDKMKYDFIVHQGGNVSDIRLKIGGANLLNLTSEGGYTASTPLGDINEQKPYSYERATKRPVASSFKQEGNSLSFITGSFSGDLVIDPTIIWATYYGGNQIDEVYKLKNDVRGNVFITGITSSVAYIATTGSHQQMIHGTYDAFLAKFDKAGAIQWSTYFGDDGDDYATSLVLASDGTIAITGTTNSNQNMATMNSHQFAYGGDANGITGDAFIAKFDVDGARIWSTYLGGHESDAGNAIVSDAGGNIFVAGMTTSASEIATQGSYKNLLVGPPLGAPPPDAFLVKFSPTGQRLWGTYFGDEFGDLATCLNINQSDDLFMAGETRSTNLATQGVFQSTYGGGASDAFVVKFSADGNPSWCTYYGGADYEHPTDIIVTGERVIYLSGSTYADGRMTTPFSNQPVFGGGGGDGFITRFTETGQQDWGTYVGGNGFDQVNGLAQDSLGNIIATGFTSSSNNMVQAPGSGRSQVLVNSTTPEGFVAKFNASGQRVWGSYFSGVGKSVGCFGNGHIYFTGYTTISGLATTGVHQTINRGNGDVLLARIDDDTTVFVTEPFIDTAFCMGAFFRLNYDVSGNFHPNNEFRAQLSDATGNFQSGPIIGHAFSAVKGSILCQLPGGSFGAGYRVRIIANHPIDTSIGCSKTINIMQGTLNTPSVSISMNPTAPVIGEPTVFSAVVSNCSGAGSFQWYKNGYRIPGATSNPYTTVVNNTDRIVVVAYCRSNCNVSDSAISNSLSLSVSKPSILAGVAAYPNPNNGTFKVAGTTETKELEIEVLSVIGQVIYMKSVSVINGRINEQIVMDNAASGIYILRLKAGQETVTERVVISR